VDGRGGGFFFFFFFEVEIWIVFFYMVVFH
jgi:hypothetical protein